ncbi:MAG: transposase, partial [Bacteroidetes bacterium]|nr:transposase [Bacteroidota bacterium]
FIFYEIFTGQVRKNNKGFRRFTLRGNSRVQIETGLLVLAHNLKKWAVA